MAGSCACGCELASTATGDWALGAASWLALADTAQWRFSALTRCAPPSTPTRAVRGAVSTKVPLANPRRYFPSRPRPRAASYSFQRVGQFDYNDGIHGALAGDAALVSTITVTGQLLDLRRKPPVSRARSNQKCAVFN